MGQLQPRKTPGDPKCPDCQEARRGYCKDHKNFHYAYDPTASIPGKSSSRRVPDPFDDERGWYDS